MFLLCNESMMCNATFAIMLDAISVVYFILEWTTSLDTSSRTLFVRICVGMSTSRRTSSYVITSDCY